MRYFYVVFMSPAGLVADYVRSKLHPMHPACEAQADIARKMTRLMGGQLCKPELIMWSYVHELEEEVARARFPQDFLGTGEAE